MTLKAFFITTFVKQNKWHSSSVLGHTLKVTYQAIKHKDYRFIIPALLHDIGKPLVAFQDESDIINDTYSFTDHEEKSYQLIKDLPFSDWTKNVVRWHYLIQDIKKCKEKGKLERYEEKRIIWNSLDEDLKKDIQTFFEYDSLGKKSWKFQFFN